MKWWVLGLVVVVLAVVMLLMLQPASTIHLSNGGVGPCIASVCPVPSP